MRKLTPEQIATIPDRVNAVGICAASRDLGVTRSTLRYYLRGGKSGAGSVSLTDAQRSEIVGLYLSGMAMETVSATYGVSAITVSRVVRAAGVETHRYLPDETIAKIHSLLREGLDHSEVGRRCGVGESTVRCHAKKLGLRSPKAKS